MGRLTHLYPDTNMTRPLLLSIICLCIGLTSAWAQHLKPGFDKAEYLELLKVSARNGDSAYVATIPEPKRFESRYRSAVMGLDNRWDLWMSKDSIAVVSIRGTTSNNVSWLANFYAAMVAAKGKIVLADNDTFEYELGANPRSAVHVGWLISTAFLARDILPKLDSCYRAGIRDVIIMGHSQGGAIAYLLTAYVYNLQKTGKLPADIRFKTYCSAGPKPGNLYFAYEYEAMTQNGWAYNVVNGADWVPETPFSVQTTDDFNEVNPFVGAKSVIRKQKFPKNIFLNHAYNQLNKPAKKARRRYQKYLGGMMAGYVKKSLKGYVTPTYVNCGDYVRTGAFVVLLPDENYYKLFPNDKKQVFIHHFFAPYIYLTEHNLMMYP